MMLTPINAFFEKSPFAKPLFDTLVIDALQRFPNTTVKVQKTQIALVSKKPYTAIWLPIIEIKDRPPVYLIVSFGLDHELKDPRIVEVNQPYPQRWMHHVLISKPEEIDELFMSWLSLAHEFSLRNPKDSQDL
ncbi:MAG: hypothetical protein FD133_862 [Erysipelotrichaceae bacterium]|nr:MAG: hypothetical protein FD179_1575 [Erysipelotrichaceae bacterium]TXT18500.1 MAG: hypothetical protein FD133_862 [Erysipelotrichaceae bacterium]